MTLLLFIREMMAQNEVNITFVRLPVVNPQGERFYHALENNFVPDLGVNVGLLNVDDRPD